MLGIDLLILFLRHQWVISHCIYLRPVEDLVFKKERRKGGGKKPLVGRRKKEARFRRLNPKIPFLESKGRI